jgi:acetylornithine deacetylase
MNVLEFARELIDIDSTTGKEQAAGDWLAARLRALGYHVDEQPVSDGRRNIVATAGEPVVVLSTHFDCVPPYIASSVHDGRLYGRGACDAKGILAAQVGAVERLRASGETRVGLLFVVGEERGSDGADVANQRPLGSRFLINGEPTDSRLAIATRGNLRVRLRATGRAAHSAAPEHGVSAIDKLLDALMQLRTLPLPADPQLGQTYYSIGLIDGGVAPNVISPHASAEVMFRTIGPPEPLLALLRQLRPLVEIEEVLRVPLARLKTLSDTRVPTAVFPFTTDIPLLASWGEPLLFGPGSFLVAHTAEEHLDLAELDAAVGTYVELAQSCLRDAAVAARGETRA